MEESMSLSGWEWDEEEEEDEDEIRVWFCLLCSVRVQHGKSTYTFCIRLQLSLSQVNFAAFFQNGTLTRNQFALSFSFYVSFYIIYIPANSFKIQFPLLMVEHNIYFTFLYFRLRGS